MKKLLFSLLFTFLSLISFGQVYNIADSVFVFTCQGTFVDAGGNNNYGPNELNQLIICSNNPVSTYTKVYFANFDVHTSDTLYVYDGMTDQDPLIGKFNNNNGLSLTPVWATILNMTGCLTFSFKSNGTLHGAGWNAQISCIEPCQKIVAALDTINLSPPLDSMYINNCHGDTITLSALGVYPQNDFAYHQEDPASRFYWNFGDNTVDSGLLVKHVYDSVRGYDVTLKIVDQRGCFSMNALGLRVRVAGNPISQVTVPPSICLGDSLQFKVGYNDNSTVLIDPISHHQSSSLRYDSATFIPDGGAIGGMCYNTYVTFNCFNPGQAVSNASDIASVCVNMEHSFIGDLNMRIICPNGQYSNVKKYIQSGGAYLGEPCMGPSGDNDPSCDCSSPPSCITNPVQNPAGYGWTYCWSMTPTWDSMNVYAGSGMGALVPGLPYTMLDSGVFKPGQSFNSLIGCPLNGTWNLQVCDYWGADNGWVFWWQLNLDPTLLPTNWGYNVFMDHATWTGPFITSETDSTALIKPTLPGNYTYNVQITDDYGCNYDTLFQVLVKPIPDPGLMPDTTICNGDTIYLQAFNGGSYHWNNGSTLAAFNVIPGDTTTYIVSVTTNACTGKDTVTINVNQIPLAYAGPDTSICNGQNLNLHGSGGLEYHWSTGANTQNINVQPANAQYYYLTVTSHNCSSSDSLIVVVNPMPQPYLGSDTALCGFDTLWISPGFTFNSYQWQNGNSMQSYPATSTGNYWVKVTNQYGCLSIDSINLIFNKIPDIQFYGIPLQGCQPLAVDFTSTIDPPPQDIIWKFGDGDSSLMENPLHTYYNTGSYTVSVKVVTGAGCENEIEYPAYVKVWKIPTAGFVANPDNTTIINPEVFFDNTSLYATSYQWDFGDGGTDTALSPNHVYSDTGTYIVQLIALNEMGCSDTIYNIVNIHDFFTFYIPNSFTPNDDGVNDYFGPFGINWGTDNKYEMSIFNRWGALVYQTTDPSMPWNGAQNNSGKI